MSTTAVAEAIPEENVMVQRLLVQSSCKRPTGVMLHLRINFDTNKTIYVMQYKIQCHKIKMDSIADHVGLKEFDEKSENRRPM